MRFGRRFRLGTWDQYRNPFSGSPSQIRHELPPAHFLATYARLDREIQEKIDFIDFDEQTAFFQFLNDIGEIKKLDSHLEQKLQFAVSQLERH